MTRKQKNRWYNYFFRMIKAHLNSYFWLPCSICGETYAGYETGEGLMTSWNEGRCTCKWCDKEAKKKNEEFMKNNPDMPILIKAGK